MVEKIGWQVIKDYLQNMPDSPGVYRMLDENGKYLYIGKAKNLKKRVSSYVKDDLITRLKRMVFLTRSMEITITRNEAEALLLEAQLIKQLQPKYNILLKDDKSFPYIKLRTDHPYPQIMKYRGRQLTGGKFFGPFASSADVDQTISSLLKIFKIRPCSDTYFAGRTRPCLQYQIKRCSAPCVGKVSVEEYGHLVTQARLFLEGKSQSLQKSLNDLMNHYSNNMEYEKAAEVRDRIKALSYIQLNVFSEDLKIQDADVFAIANKTGQWCVQVFCYRAGQSYGNKPYFPIYASDTTLGEALESFIGLFYQTRPAPRNIIVNTKINLENSLADALSEYNKQKITITYPKSGGKLKLAEIAEENAIRALEAKLGHLVKNEALLEEFANLFELDVIPERIEVYDNSHISGKYAIGAMIVATPEGFDKNEYRLFNIKEAKPNITGGDDYAMMREVMKRRLKRLKLEPERRPDFMLIDGGKGHMGVIGSVMDEMEEYIPFACISKGEKRDQGGESFHMPGRDPFTLSNDAPIMKYLQILRDEVHGFVIRSHRNKRSKSISISAIDSIPSIGKTRKKALLSHFGSFANIENSSISDLMKVPGISKSLAEHIYNYIHKEADN